MYRQVILVGCVMSTALAFSRTAHACAIQELTCKQEDPCLPDVKCSVSFTGSVCPTKVTWGFGDGTPKVVGLGGAQYHSYSQPGTYTVTAAYGAKGGLSTSVVVTAPPVTTVTFTASPPPPVCRGTEVCFTAQATNLYAKDLNWSLPDGSSTSLLASKAACWTADPPYVIPLTVSVFADGTCNDATYSQTVSLRMCGLTGIEPTRSGACCLEGTCHDLTYDACREQRGTFKGDFTACDGTNCCEDDTPSRPGRP